MTTVRQASLSFTISQSFPKFLSIASVMPSCHFILWCPLLLMPSILPSIRDFSNESAVCIRRPKYWHFSFSISPSNENSVSISLKIDWFDLLAVQGTLKSLLQHHSLKASILWCSVFFRIQLSQLYLITAKTIITLFFIEGQNWSAFPFIGMSLRGLLWLDTCQENKYPRCQSWAKHQERWNQGSHVKDDAIFYQAHGNTQVSTSLHSMTKTTTASRKFYQVIRFVPDYLRETKEEQNK